MHRLDVYVSSELYRYLMERKSREGVVSLSELVRAILHKSMDEEMLGVGREEGARIRPAELMLRCFEILVELQSLYETTLRQRGEDGAAVVARARANAESLVRHLREAA